MRTVLTQDAPCNCRTATSWVGSAPTTFAEYLAPVATTATLMLMVAVDHVVFGQHLPLEVSTMPVPAASAP